MTDSGGTIRRHQPGRIDFLMETCAVDKETGRAQVALKPDPRRYDKVTDESGTHYIDKFLRILISEDVMFDGMVKQMGGLPIYNMEPSIESSLAYASERAAAVQTELVSGQHVKPSQAAQPHKVFTDNPNARDVAFLSIDIVGGSAMRASFPAAFERTYRILFQEFASTIGLFHGSIVKATGDGCIAVIDHPAFTSSCDTVADLGLTLLVVLRDAVNPALFQAGLRPIQVRIGADFGLAEIRTIEVPAIGFKDREVASDALNRAVKIEQSCGPDEFRVGYTLYGLMHVKWLERAAEVSFDPHSVGMDSYKVFRLT